MSRRQLQLTAAMGLAVMALGLALGRAGAVSAAESEADKVVIVALPGLQWEALTGVRPPALDAFLARAAVASLSIRTVGPVTTAADAYVTIGAGNRADVGGRARLGDWASVLARADSLLYGAEPGALATALADHGRSMAVVGAPGTPAALAATTRSGAVTSVASLADGLGRHDVVLAEASSVAELDRLLAVADLARHLVMVLGVSAPDDDAELTVFALAGPSTQPGLARSATTRRAGFVTLPDIAPTVLRALQIPIPDSINGTRVVSVDARPFDTERARQLAEVNEITVFRDRAVGPVSVTFVVVQVAGYGLAAWAVSRGRGRRWHRCAYAVALLTLAVPIVAFGLGAFDVTDMALAAYTVLVMGLAGALALATWPLRRLHGLAPPLVLAAASLAVQVGDVASGARLQLNTVFGYSPTVAGRFAGFGNLAFAIVAMSAIVTATGIWVFQWPRRRLLAISATVLAAAVLADGAPMLGSDVGGALALAPAAGAVLLTLTGRRLSAARALLIGAVTLAVVALFVGYDLTRPDDARTHLGRFAARLADGEAGLVLRRKLSANWHILTSSVWTWVIPAAFAYLAFLIWRPSGRLGQLQHEVAGFRACLIGAVVAGALGFALNDSGIAIPAMMCGIVLPWITCVALERSAP